jgi:HSP20 family molecular chaperone IbpA
MIVLRRSRATRSTAPPAGLDVAFELDAGPLRHRHGCVTAWRPPIEVFETEQALVVRAEIGGVSDDQLAVLIEGDQLVIRGERIVAAHHGRRLYHESRVRYGEFAVAVLLPFLIDSDGAAAEYVDGFLTVNLPRLAATRIAAQDHGWVTAAQQGEQ